MVYAVNKLRSITRDTAPSLTDQAGARETDINIIVGRMIVTGTAPGTTKQPMSGDFTDIPEDLRGMIEASRSINHYRRNLPDKLQGIPVTELLTMTPEQLKRILTPPAPPPAPPEPPK